MSFPSTTHPQQKTFIVVYLRKVLLCLVFYSSVPFMSCCSAWWILRADFQKQRPISWLFSYLLFFNYTEENKVVITFFPKFEFASSTLFLSAEFLTSLFLILVLSTVPSFKCKSWAGYLCTDSMCMCDTVHIFQMYGCSSVHVSFPVYTDTLNVYCIILGVVYLLPSVYHYFFIGNSQPAVHCWFFFI